MATKSEITIHSSATEYLTFIAATGDNKDSIEMRYEDENIWLTQKMMATHYDVDVRTVNEHIKHIYEAMLLAYLIAFTICMLQSLSSTETISLSNLQMDLNLIPLTAGL